MWTFADSAIWVCGTCGCLDKCSGGSLRIRNEDIMVSLLNRVNAQFFLTVLPSTAQIYGLCPSLLDQSVTLTPSWFIWNWLASFILEKSRFCVNILLSAIQILQWAWNLKTTQQACMCVRKSEDRHMHTHNGRLEEDPLILVEVWKCVPVCGRRYRQWSDVQFLSIPQN